jgi:hypothetical protein
VKITDRDVKSNEEIWNNESTTTPPTDTTHELVFIILSVGLKSFRRRYDRL